MDRSHHDSEQTGATSTLEVLLHGTIEVEGRLPYSSNYSLLTQVVHGEETIYAVYKPLHGERPLWDFPQGTLYRREIAAYIVSEALGFSFVPPTVSRDGPYGTGALQQFIYHNPESHLLTMQHEGGYEQDLLRLAAFDYLVNNADRKSGHCLKGLDGRLWAIDHGICFHHEYKLRTVLWDFAGLPLSPDILQAFRSFQHMLKQQHAASSVLKALLFAGELRALHQRLSHLIQTGVYPEPGPGPNIPWPPV